MKNRLWNTFKELTDIYSPSFGERQFCDALKKRFSLLGIDLKEDGADKILKGNSGNLYGFIPGKTDGPAILFSAHMDTVEPAYGKRAILHEDGCITSAGDTILGADDVAGITVIIEAITRLKERNIPHRPIELLFCAAEEKYGAGSSVLDYSLIKAKEAYVLDLSGPVGEAANAAPTIISFEINVRGKAAHAGFAPEDGIHAIEAAAKAIARLPQGRLPSGLTFNIGQISGGKAGNIVPDLCTVKGEIRSLDHKAAVSYWDEVIIVFNDEAKAKGAKAEGNKRIEITAYETPPELPVIRRFVRACEKLDIPCNIRPTFGGSDLNNFALHGIKGLVIACGMNEVHSTREYSNINELEKCVKLVMELMADGEVQL